MDNPFALTGKRILVTGASSGIGRACCVQIAAMGGNLILTGRNETRIKETLASMTGEGHTFIVGDLLDLVNSGQLVSVSPELDGVVHSAGVTKLVPVRMINQAVINELSRVNYDAPVLLSQQLLKHRRLRKGASVVFVSSIAAQIATKGNGIYSGQKAALCSFARILALEVAHQKIRVNTVSPGHLKTPFTQTNGPISPEMLAEYEKHYPLGFGEASDVAFGIVYLLSDASRWLTGTNLVMDGGFLLD